MEGRIIKAIAGFGYVASESGVYECKPKGIFRKDKVRPLVGDYVEIEVLDEEEKVGVITEIRPRTNCLIRPASSNVDQAMIIFAMEEPRPSLALLDRFLIMMEEQEVPVIICFNKEELGAREEVELLRSTYEGCGYQVLMVSAKEGRGMDKIRNLLAGRTTVVAGPSGVGKSTITNLLQSHIEMETGSISKKLKRGKHTTRHAQLIQIDKNTWFMDTPGFSSLTVGDMKKEDLRFHFPEFTSYEGACRFQGCVHISEPSCRVREAVEAGEISRIRYEDYKELFEELKDREKRRY